MKCEKRNFKTSINGVKIRKEAKSTSSEVWKIDKINTELKVLWKAVVWEYVDAYKTDRWYPVEYNWKKGYVLATLLHIKQLWDVEIDDNFLSSWRKRPKKVKVTGIVLHATLWNNSAVDDRNWEKPKRWEWAQYYIDRNGNKEKLLNEILHGQDFEMEKMKKLKLGKIILKNN